MRRLNVWLLGGLLLALGLAAPGAYAQKDDKSKDVVMVYPRSQSFLGVAVAEVNAERARALKLSEEHGVEITRVEDDSSASKAGLQAQDIVLEYQGQRVEGMEQFIRMVRETPAGREVKMLVHRAGKPLTLTATIASKRMRTLTIGDRQIVVPHVPEIRLPEIPRVALNWRAPLGVEVQELNPQLAEFFGVKEGVLVRSVNKGGAADKAGIRAGDVIVKVDGKTVSSPLEVTQALRLSDKKPIPLTVMREKKEMAVNVTIESSEDTVPRGRVVRNREYQF